MSGGQVVSEVVDGSRRFDVVLRLADEDRTGAGLAAVMIETPGGRVPLSLLAEVRDTDGPNQILRENGRRRIVVLANTDGSDMAGDRRSASAPRWRRPPCRPATSSRWKAPSRRRRRQRG